MADLGAVRVNDFEMDYFKFGTGEKTFVIIPGISIQSVMGAADAVQQGYELMNEDFTTYVFDRRKEISEGYSIREMARDTAEAVKALGLKDIYLFGASQGGMIAMVMAIEYPELVKKMVLGSTSSHIKPEQQKVLCQWIELAKKNDKQELYQCFGREVYPPEVYEQYKDYFAEVSKTVTDKEMERFMILAESIKDFNVTDQLVKIQCPVLAMGVYEDPVLDSDATMEIAEKLDYHKDFKLFMYIGYGHAAFDTAPDYRKRILEFFLE